MVNKGLQPLCLFLAIFPSAFCVLIVSIRVWTRVKRRQYGIEDTLLVIATILNLVLSVTTSGYIFNSYHGYHYYDIPEGAIDPILMRKWNYANSIVYNPILALVKLSFLWTLIKLQSQNRWINCCLWSVLILNGCFAIAAPLACIFQCNPVAKYWDSTIAGECVHAGAYTVSTSSIVLFTDVLILIMPTWILHDINMPFGRKLMVIAFLSFGVAVTIVGAVRTSVLVKLFVLKEVESDPTYSLNYLLSNIESGFAIIGTCGPTIKYILGFCFPALKTENESSNRRYLNPYRSGSHGGSRSRHYIKNTKTNDTFKEIDKDFQSECDWPHSNQSDEMTTVPGSEQPHARRNTDSDEQLMITKTVAWKVDTV